jgi:hypothetical protein
MEQTVTSQQYFTQTNGSHKKTEQSQKLLKWIATPKKRAKTTRIGKYLLRIE